MNAELVCEMYGGPFDGEVRHIRAGRDGLPLGQIRYAQVNHNPWALLNFDDPVPPPPGDVRLVVAVYVRGDISEDTHRWRYHFRGEQR